MFILSDFGYSDTYVAQMKAVILSFAGYDTPVIDLTHGVLPGNILQGAYHLRSALHELPEGSVTLAVIDPGVGSDRLGLAALWRGRFIVAPDNGLLSLLPGPVRVWKLPPPDPGSSHTFHGRDVFAVCAAKLAVDPGWTSYLEPHENPLMLKETTCVFSREELSVAVLHVDNFGNCVLGATAEDLKLITPLTLLSSGQDIPLIQVESYYQSPVDAAVLFLTGSAGFCELAVNGGSAAEKLHLKPGSRITLKIKRSNSQ
ncbi:MAG: SAM-dependent chlorinase/fluorinase [Candidatus Fermentibacteria bacterium]|nr:SAM-dependent chlorinase/fluorinase [Candidatus Fermentibacteria bacterium]